MEALLINIVGLEKLTNKKSGSFHPKYELDQQRESLGAYILYDLFEKLKNNPGSRFEPHPVKKMNSNDAR